MSEGRDAVRAEEEARLAETLGLVRAALGEAEALHGRIEDGYREAKRYQVAYRGEIDPAEAFQNELALAEVDRRGAVFALLYSCADNLSTLSFIVLKIADHRLFYAKVI